MFSGTSCILDLSLTTIIRLVSLDLQRDVTGLRVPDFGISDPRPECEFAMTGELFSAYT